MAKGKNIFNSVLFPSIRSNNFNLSHNVRMSFRMGWLTPSCVMDIVPGDRVTINVSNMLRFAPLLAPLMETVNVTTHYYFVPNRIMWPQWEQWITGDLEAVPPYFVPTTLPAGCLGDYLGFPTDFAAGTKISAFPVHAYLRIWNEYYRDQNLSISGLLDLVSGDNTPYAQIPTAAANVPISRAWEHDYFTSALPFAQKGDAVVLPLVTGKTDVKLKSTTDDPALILRQDNHTNFPNASPLATGANAALTVTGLPAVVDPNSTLEVDIQSGATDINTLRRAFRLQEWLERNARGGTRYIENILSHFGVKSSDARLQRPEYLGGAFQRMVISEVLSTAETTDAPIGQMAGHGISVGSGQSFSYRAEEHGWIIGIINVQPVTAYSQGVHRSLTREDRLDYFWPSFANIGEQEVKVKELYADTLTLAEQEETFGYVPRYAEYKYMNNRVAGEMRTSLNFWHMAREFAAKPLLNSSFVTADPTDRVFAVQTPDAHNIYAHIINNVYANRKMPRFGIPTI